MLSPQLCCANARQETLEHNEVTAATHVLGPHLMTSLLLPALRVSHGRVIVVSSGGMYGAALPVEGDITMPVDKYDGVTQYAIAKRAQVTLNAMWASQEPQVQFHAMHPGWVDTPGLQTALPKSAHAALCTCAPVRLQA
jgi:dehydrogenase/reductase SDR family protein 12